MPIGPWSERKPQDRRVVLTTGYTASRLYGKNGGPRGRPRSLRFGVDPQTERFYGPTGGLGWSRGSGSPRSHGRPFFSSSVPFLLGRLSPVPSLPVEPAREGSFPFLFVKKCVKSRGHETPRWTSFCRVRQSASRPFQGREHRLQPCWRVSRRRQPNPGLVPVDQAVGRFRRAIDPGRGAYLLTYTNGCIIRKTDDTGWLTGT